MSKLRRSVTFGYFFEGCKCEDCKYPGTCVLQVELNLFVSEAVLQKLLLLLILGTGRDVFAEGAGPCDWELDIASGRCKALVLLG